MSFYHNICFVIVGFLWGATNPLIKRGSTGIQNIQTDSKLKNFYFELKFLVTRWQYILPFLLNQFGSLLYVYLLQNSELSLAVPIANSCTFIFTALMAMYLNEQMPNKLSFIGMLLIAIGIIICVYSKM